MFRKVRRTKRSERRRRSQMVHRKRVRDWTELGHGEDVLKWYWLKSTGKPCSCQMCRNIRRSSLFKAGNRITNQEKRAVMAYGEQLREYYDAQDVSA